MGTLPTGEILPEYEDEPQVDPLVLRAWCVQHRGWVDNDRTKTIVDVLAALEAVGDATLVKNGTYRALLRDRDGVERLGAALHRVGAVGPLLEHDGNIVDTAIEGLEIARAAVEAEIARARAEAEQRS